MILEQGVGRGKTGAVGILARIVVALAGAGSFDCARRCASRIVSLRLIA